MQQPLAFLNTPVNKKGTVMYICINIPHNIFKIYLGSFKFSRRMQFGVEG